MQTDPELIKAWSEMIRALAWPVIIIGLAPFVLWFIHRWVVKNNKELEFNVKNIFSVIVKPTQGIRPPGNTTAGENAPQKTDMESIAASPGKPLPADYFFMNHTSFLRPEKQEEFQKRTGIHLNHYDIRVIVDSYYRGAMERIDCVEYVLHRSYPVPLQIRRNPEDHFLLKELANGEYVLLAKVYLKDRKEPIVLQRYITLWADGPRFE
jgi:hypothetical protein